LGVESLDIKTFVQQFRNIEECEFGYRTSIFKTDIAGNEFITRVILKLIPGDRMEIYEKTQQKIDYRNNRHPMDYPSIGSTFKNIPLDSLSHDLQKEFSPIVKIDPLPVVSVTKLLTLCNLKGKKVGGAMISDKQPNFIVNVNNATCEDVKTLIEEAKQAIRKKYNIDLEEEIIYLD
jgi:UDP-N-acetylmuramate dehydrogenase